MAKFEGIAVAPRQHAEKRCQPLAIFGELGRQLEQYGAYLGRQRLEPGFHERDRVVAAFAEPLPVSDELRCLPSKTELLGCLIAPRPHCLERGRAVERTVDLGGRKPGGVPGEPVPLRYLLRIERPAPAVIGPARRAYAYAAHALTPWRLTESPC